ncbi:uncharacterized protein N7479_011086 [Penicillium vulpinum]|uniref:Uncharacterized protein n=1 Tax=Penicillium vulpinum TaxID=29845 RepID=A0A1V6RTS7_9EURO|nr:uncharacterized protein N7479_011086 [Penicillium vulpinum]KAJ5952673.1 hypothetical protein N7479_011086 [Penicillium vulpinum]OQE04889.1 hypothetical protein PENVUL_c029G07850 [Penicillium vulpinum]
MPGCCPWNCFNICRRRNRSPGFGPQSPSDEEAAIELQTIPPPPPPLGNDASTEDGNIDLNVYQYGQRQMWGELRQRWIDDPNEPNCTVQPPDFEYRSLAHTKRRSERWIVKFDRWIPRPPALSADLENCGLPVGSEDYHEAKLTKQSSRPSPRRGTTGINIHHIAAARGVIILRNVDRYDGPWWSQVALAQYDVHFGRNDLRHIYLENVINVDTRDFIQTLWAETQPANSPRFQLNPEAGNQVSWEFDTPGYKAILGTELGKGVAAIVVSAFNRGSRRIARVVVWRATIMQIRFDIEPRGH